MTRINTLQERKTGTNNASQIAVNLIHRVRKKSTILLVVTWQSSGAPARTTVSDLSVIPDPANSPLVRVSVPYVPLAGAGSSPPIYAGVTGNAIGMAVLAVRGSDIRAIQGTTYPSNLVVSMTKSVGRLIVSATELSNFPSFKYRDIQVQAISNANANGLTLRSNQRPSSLDIVGMAVATPRTRTVNKPWGGSDGRYLGKNSLANKVATLAPWAMANLEGIAQLLGGVGSAADSIRGTASLLDIAFQALPPPFVSAPGCISWTHSYAEANIDIANWLNGLWIQDARDITQADLHYLNVIAAGESSDVAQPIFILARAYVQNPSLGMTLDGTSPALVDAVLPSFLQNGDVILEAIDRSSIKNEISNYYSGEGLIDTINAARVAAGGTTLSSIYIGNIFRLMEGGEPQMYGFAAADPDLFALLSSAGQALKDAIDLGQVIEEIPPI